MGPTILHLVDDTTAGGVMQVVKHLQTAPDLAALGKHKVRKVVRGALRPVQTDAEIIVSHLAISWRTLPSLLALRMRYPFRTMVHVEHSYTGAFVKHNVPHIGRFEALLRLGFGLFDRVVAVSEGQREWMKSRKLVATRKLFLVRSYHDLSPFLDVPDRDGPIRHFGAIGRLDRQKGFDELINAFRQTNDRNLRLTVFGTGSEEGYLKSLAENDNRITFAGHQTEPQLAFAQVDAVIMPSRWEAYGLVAIEALAAGRMVVCRDVDGLVDHAAIGAEVIGTVGPELFDARKNSPLQAAPRQVLVDWLQSENMAAWRAVLSIGNRQRGGVPNMAAARAA